jgi:hypothetical protein
MSYPYCRRSSVGEGGITNAGAQRRVLASWKATGGRAVVDHEPLVAQQPRAFRLVAPQKVPKAIIVLHALGSLLRR